MTLFSYVAHFATSNPRRSTVRISFASLSLSLLLAASAALAQPAPTPLPVPATLPVDAPAIASVCAVIPATPPTLTGPARAQAFNLTLRAGAAHSRGNFAEAATLYWQAFGVTREVAPLAAITVELQGVGPSEQSRLCALLSCVISRTPEGPELAELVQRQQAAHCPVQAVVTPNVPVGLNPPVRQNQTFVLSTEELAAVEADRDLAADIGRSQADGFIVGPAREWHVPARFRARVAAALDRRRASQRILAPTPRRSFFGYALPIAGWTVGAGLLAGALVTGLRCNEANAELERANMGLTNGWSRQAAADASNNCLAFNVLLPAGLVALGGGTAAWFALAPSAGPNHAALNLTLRFRLF